MRTPGLLVVVAAVGVVLSGCRDEEPRSTGYQLSWADPGDAPPLSREGQFLDHVLRRLSPGRASDPFTVLEGAQNFCRLPGAGSLAVQAEAVDALTGAGWTAADAGTTVRDAAALLC